MSNSAHIKVHSIDKEYPEQEKRYNVIVSDNYSEGSFTTDHDFDSPEDILRYCIDYGSNINAEVCAVIDFVLEHQTGITINNVSYSWDKIKHIFGMGEED